MEWEVKRVNSRGLSWSADWHSLFPQSSTRHMSAYNQLRLMEGQAVSIYVCSSALRFFVTRVLRSVKRKFVLVCGDCDQDFPDQCLSTSMFEYLLGNKNLVHIFAQNCRITHPRVTRMPIGLDYHTIRNVQPPADQEAVLTNIADRHLPLKNANYLFTPHFISRCNTKPDRRPTRTSTNHSCIRTRQGSTWGELATSNRICIRGQSAGQRRRLSSHMGGSRSRMHSYCQD